LTEVLDIAFFVMVMNEYASHILI